MCKSLKQRIEDGRITGLVGLACFVASQALAADNSVQDPVQTELQEIRERLQRLEAARPTPKDSDKGALSSVPRFRVSDGLIIEDSDGKWSVRATARAMTDYRDYLDSPAKADTFSLRRARIGLGFTVNKEFTGFLESELVFGAGTQAGTAASAGLLQGFLEYAPSPRARLRLGQFKPQFMLEATMSPFHVDFQERSLMFNLLQNFLYDRGLMLHGAPWPGVYYGLSATNGTGINLDEFQRNAPEGAAASKDVTARLVGNAAAWTSIKDTVVHFGGSHKTGTVANGDASTPGYAAPNGLTEDRGVVFFNPVPFNTGNGIWSSTIDRAITAGEFVAAFKQFKVQAEYARASYAGELQSGESFDRHLTAGYVSASWLLTGELFSEAYRNGVFARISPSNPFSTSGRGPGAVQLSVRYSVFDGADFKEGNAIGTGALGGNNLAPLVTQSSPRADAYTVALKWMPTTHVAFILNYVRTQFDTPVVANGAPLRETNAVTLRGQFDFF